jgi:hypothetical protein
MADAQSGFAPDALVDRVLDACDDYFLATDHPEALRDASGGRANLVDALGKLADALDRLADSFAQLVTDHKAETGPSRDR